MTIPYWCSVATNAVAHVTTDLFNPDMAQEMDAAHFQEVLGKTKDLCGLLGLLYRQMNKGLLVFN